MEKLITVVIVLAVVGLLSISPIIAYSTDEEVTCKVVSKERITKQDSSKYIVFCEDEVFENTDSLWYWKWNSSDVYRDLKEGEEYNLTVIGYRVPFLSWQRNIIEVK